MSDETGVAAEAPPVESPAVEAPVEPAVEAVPEPELEEGAGRHIARRRTLQRAKAAQERYARGLEEGRGQPREEAGQPEGGQFKTEEPEGEPPAAVVEATEVPTETPAAATSEAVAADSQVETPAADASGDWVDIPLPDGHPLRDRGQTQIRAWKEQEAEVRNGINAAVKLRETQRELEIERRDRTMLEARTKALGGDGLNHEADPRYQALLQQVRDAKGFGDEMADELISGMDAKRELAQVRAEQQASIDLHTQKTTDEFADATYARAQEVFGVWRDSGELDMRVVPLMKEYVLRVDNLNTSDGGRRVPNVDEFFHYARRAYGSDPRVAAAVKQLQEGDKTREIEKIRHEERVRLTAEHAKDAAAAATRHATRPPLGRPGALPTTQTPEPEPVVDRTPKRAGNYAKEARARILERFKGMEIPR